MRSKGLIAAGVMMAAVAGVAHGQELLQQPGFEDPVITADVPLSQSGSAWSGWNNWVDPYSGFLSGSHPRTGTQGGKTFSGPNAGIYQNVSATPGTSYVASAWFFNASNDQVVVDEATWDVRLTFYAEDGGQIGDPFVSQQLVPAAVVDTWTQLSVNAVAPAGTTSVTFMMFMNNPQFGGGAMFVDDASLTAAATGTPGDYNGDGFVDSADYTVWADHFGQTGSGIAGDGNGDGVVDSADYTVWADHFGQGTPPAAAIPEPAAAGLLLAGLPLVMRRRR